MIENIYSAMNFITEHQLANVGQNWSQTFCTILLNQKLVKSIRFVDCWHKLQKWPSLTFLLIDMFRWHSMSVNISFCHSFKNLLVKVSDPWVIWVQFFKITCLHSNLILDILSPSCIYYWSHECKKRVLGTYVFLYLAIWILSFEYHTKVSPQHLLMFI